jgi:hypothetical protein
MQRVDSLLCQLLLFPFRSPLELGTLPLSLLVHGGYSDSIATLMERCIPAHVGTPFLVYVVIVGVEMMETIGRAVLLVPVVDT